MARSIDCRVEPSSIVDLFSLRVTKEGGDYLIGRHGARSYLALTPIALEAATMLGEHVPVARVKERLAAKYDVDRVSLAPLLQQLLSAGLVRAIDGRPVEGGTNPDSPRRSLLTRRRVAPFFGKPALATYALILAGGLAALFDPRSLPRLDLLIAERSYGMLLLSTGLLGAIVAKHEWAHLAAGKFLGVDARWRLGHRLFFPVVETDLSDLWMVERRKRYIAYGAGVFSDLLAASLALIGMWAHVHGWIALTTGVYRALELTVLIVAVSVIWQCNVFLRTDGYYVLANALGCRNLAGDAKAYLRTRSAAYPRSVRLYAIGYVATVAVLCVSWVIGLMVVLRAGGASAGSTRVALSMTTALLLVGVWAERRRTAARYRLVHPAGLSLLLAVSPPAAYAGELPGPSYRIDVVLDAAQSSLHGRETLEMWNRSGRPIQQIELHLHANAYRDSATTFARDRRRLAAFGDPRTAVPSADSAGSIAVREVRLHGKAVVFEVDGTVLRVPLAAPLAPGESLLVEMAFEVRIPRFLDRLAVRDGNVVMGAWFPKLAVLDERGWHSGQRRGLGEFYSEAGDYVVDITVPSGFVVGATGGRVDLRVNGDGTETSRWEARRVRDFAWVADRDYQVTDLTEHGINIRYLALPGRQRTSASGIRLAADALAYFGRIFSPYPYRDFTIAEAAAVESGIAIEYPQLILLSEDLVASSGFVAGYEPALVHEAAHQWWYGLVGNDEIAEAWLDEAFATYSTRRFLRDRYGSEPPVVRWPKPLRFLPAPTQSEMARSMYVSQARAGFDRPIRQPAPDFHDRQTYLVSVYYKGAAVLEMLEYLVGAPTFDQILREYVEQYAFQNARTADFIRTAERVSSRSLNAFFSQWLDGTAACDYSVDGVDVHQQNELYESAIRITRRGDIAMPIVVRVSFDGGGVDDLAWDGRERQTTLTVRGPRPVRGVQIDPDRRLLETDVQNNVHPRRRLVSWNPLSMPDNAYSVSLVPLVGYGGGFEVGGALAFGGPPSFGFPYGMRRKHGGWMSALRDVRRQTTRLQFSYSTPLDRLGARGLAGATVTAEPGETRTRGQVQWFVGDGFYSAPSHTIELFALHDRQTSHDGAHVDRAPFDAGTTRSVGASYVFNRLTTDYFPLNGGLVAASIELGAPAIGSDWAFARATVRAETYVPVTSRLKLALVGFHGELFGDGPVQKAIRLIEDANFVGDRFKHLGARSLTAVNAELRIPIVASSLAGAAFVNVAHTRDAVKSGRGVFTEAGIGLRLFDNAPFAVQIDWPLWAGGPVFDPTRRLDARRLVFRVGRVFDRN